MKKQSYGTECEHLRLDTQQLIAAKHILDDAGIRIGTKVFMRCGCGAVRFLRLSPKLGFGCTDWGALSELFTHPDVKKYYGINAEVLDKIATDFGWTLAKDMPIDKQDTKCKHDRQRFAAARHNKRGVHEEAFQCLDCKLLCAPECDKSDGNRDYSKWQPIGNFSKEDGWYIYLWPQSR